MYIPSEEMGDYEDYRTRQKKKSGGVLYPLDEEGTYGAPPAPPAPLPKPLPGYAKRERKPKQYASYAVSSDCCMHAEKLENNECQTTLGRKVTPPRGRTPPKGRTPPPRRSSAPSRTKDTAPARPKDPTTTRPKDPAPVKTKWQNTSRDSGYFGSTPRWQDSLRGGRESLPPGTPQQTRRHSTLPRKTGRGKSSSVSPNRSRTISTSPDRLRRQSTSPDRGAGGRTGSGARSSSDWGYTDFSTFTANRKTSDYSSTSPRKASSERKPSQVQERRESGGVRGSSRDYSQSDYSRKSSSKDYSASVSRDYSTTSKEYSRSSREYSSTSGSSREYSSPLVSRKENNQPRSGSPVKIGLSALKAPTITEWDQMGILGLSSKMFKESTNKKESMQSSTYIRKESFTAKVM